MTGITDGQNVAVLEGLNEGDKVVTDGADRLRDGAHVTVAQPGQARPDNANPPENAQTPRPERRRTRQ